MGWLIELADEIEPYRLGVTVRMVTLAVMVTARWLVRLRDIHRLSARF